MDEKAFTAGVVPGGLTSDKEIRILVCVLLSGLSAPISHTYLLQSMTDNGLVNYFEAADAVSELLAQNHIELAESGYVITETGRSIAELLCGDVPLTVRERACERAAELLRRQVNSQQHEVDITERDDGFLVRGSISDVGSSVFAVEVYAPTKLDAVKIRQNFINDGEDIMRSVYEKLTKEPE